MRETYPRFYDEIVRLVRREALEAKTARAIMRRAGVRLSSSPQASASPGLTTVVDAFVEPYFDSLYWQWYVDLTPYTQIRAMSASIARTYLWYSPTPSGALDPGDFEQMRTLVVEMDPFSPGSGPFDPTPPYRIASASHVNSVFSHNLWWHELTEEQRGPCRLTPSDSSDALGLSMSSYNQGDQNGFSFAVQVK